MRVQISVTVMPGLVPVVHVVKLAETLGLAGNRATWMAEPGHDGVDWFGY